MTNPPAASAPSINVGFRPELAFSYKVGTRSQIAAGALLAAIYLVALGAGQDSVALGLILVSAGVAVASPVTGLAMFAVIMPMREPDIFVPIRFNAVMAGGIALGCILRLPIDRLRFRIHPGIALLLGYLLVSGLSLVPILSGAPPDWLPSALNMFLRLCTGVALFLSAGYLFQMMSPRPILILALVGATLAALLAIGDLAGLLPFEALTRGLVADTGGLRAGGAFNDPNFLGLYMATAAVFWLGVLVTVRRRTKLALLPVVGLLFLCLFVSYSRGAYLGVVAGLVALVALRSRVAAVALLVVAAVMALILYPAFLEARQGGELSPSDAYDMLLSENSRATIAAAAVAMFAAYPIFGVGYGVFQFASPAYFEGGSPDSSFSHNQYLNVLAEQGIVGVAIVGGLLALLAIHLRRSTSPYRGPALAMGATFLATSLFLHSATVFQSSSLIWLVMAAALATGRDRTDRIAEA